MAENDFPIGANPDSNRLDVSLQIVSDASLQALQNLSAQLSTLNEYLVAQGRVDTGSRAAGMTNVVQRTAAATQGTGIAHGVTPGAQVPGPDIQNPSVTGAEQARRAAEQYQRYIETGRPTVRPDGEGGFTEVNPTGPSPEVDAQLRRRLSELQMFRMARMENRAGVLEPDRWGPGPVSRVVNRFAYLYNAPRIPEDRTENDLSGQSDIGLSGSGETAGRPSRGASTPGSASGGRIGPPRTPDDNSSGGMGDYGDMPEGLRTVADRGISANSHIPFTIPRLGEFTIQDKLNMATQVFGRQAMRVNERGDNPGRALQWAAASDATAIAAQHSAAFVAIGQELRRSVNAVRQVNQSVSGMGLERTGGALGGDVELLGMGFRSPLAAIPGIGSEAATEGWRQRINQFRNRLRAGISGEQAAQIAEISREMGTTGDMNAYMQRDFFGPLTQQGIDAPDIANITERALRTGTTNMDDFRDSILQLGRAARGSQVSVRAAAEAADAFATAMGATGGRFTTSVNAATVFTRAGINPQQQASLTQGLQAPMTQGIITSQFGIAPQMQGVLSSRPELQAQAAGTAITRALQMGEIFNQDIIDPNTGKPIPGSGRDKQIAAAAQFSNYDVELIRRFQDNPGLFQHATQASAQLQRWEQDAPRHVKMAVTADQARNRNRKIRDDQKAADALEPLIHQTTGAYHDMLTDMVNDARKESDTLYVSPRDAIREVTHPQEQWRGVERELLALNPKDKGWRQRVMDLRSETDPQERMQRANEMITEMASPKREPDALIDMTDATKKYFKKVDADYPTESPRDAARRGSTSGNSNYLGPGYPTTRSGSGYHYGTPGSTP